MNYLLDTHIWLWIHGEPERLSSSVVRELEATTNDLWVSPVSFWEVLLLVEKRRLSLGAEPLEWLELALGRTPVKEASFTMEVAKEVNRIQLAHNDPADRFLVATARVYDLTLVTGDERLLGLKGLATLPNR